MTSNIDSHSFTEMFSPQRRDQPFLYLLLSGSHKHIHSCLRVVAYLYSHGGSLLYIFKETGLSLPLASAQACSS